MSNVSKASASRTETMEGFEGRYEEVDGYMVGFETFTQGGDFTPFFKGLPDDRCQSPHWGYVFNGALTIHHPEHDEVIEAGKAYYVGPGHTGEVADGTEILEFSPADLYKETVAVIMKNMEEMG